jgi:hypothetical protein
MRSVVSFRFDGEHNKEPMAAMLKARLKHCFVEFEGNTLIRCYVTTTDDESKACEVVRNIKGDNSVVTDRTRNMRVRFTEGQIDAMTQEELKAVMRLTFIDPNIHDGRNTTAKYRKLVFAHFYPAGIN